MSRRTRTLEILTAAGLVPGRLAIEQAKGARDARVAQALASLVPQAISAGTSALGKVADYQADQDLLALKRDTLDAKTAATDVAKTKADADAVRIASEAAAREAETARKATEQADERMRSSITAGVGSGAALPITGGERRVVAEFRPGESPLDELEAAQKRTGSTTALDEMAGLVDQQALAKRKQMADIKRTEQLATAPAGGDPEMKDLQKRRTLAEIKWLEGRPERETQEKTDAAAKEARKESRLTSGEATAVIELKGAQKLLDDLANLKKTGGKDGAEINTGPIENIIGWVAGKVGTQSPEWTTFKATAGSQLAEYIKSISGATVSTPERASLLQNVPTPSDDDEEFLAKLQAVNDILQTKLSTMKAGYKAAGRDTAIFDDDAEAQADAIFSDD